MLARRRNYLHLWNVHIERINIPTCREHYTLLQLLGPLKLMQYLKLSIKVFVNVLQGHVPTSK
jgi:hypothetical protein